MANLAKKRLISDLKCRTKSAGKKLFRNIIFLLECIIGVPHYLGFELVLEGLVEKAQEKDH